MSAAEQDISSPASSDFTVISPSSLSQWNGDVSLLYINSLSNLSEALSEASTDISLNEIHVKFKELLRENMNLKETIQQNSNMMKEQYSDLVKWREQMKQAEERHIANYEETKKVVLQLKADKKSLEEKITLLEECLQKNQLEIEEKSVLKQQLLEKEKQIEVLEKQVSQCESEKECFVHVIPSEGQKHLENKYKICIQENEGSKMKIKHLEEEREELHKIMMEMDTLLKSMHTSNERLEIENGELIKSKNELKNEIEVVNNEYHKLLTTHQRLQLEKQDLMALNSELSNQLANETKRFIDSCFTMVEPNADQTSVMPEVVQTSANVVPNRGMSDLLIQLQEERGKIAYLTSQITEQQATIEALQKEIRQKEEKLYESVNQDVHLSIQHEERVEELFSHLSSLNDDIRQQKASSLESKLSEDIQCLRQQVLSLVNELKESENKFKLVDTSLTEYRNRCCDLQHRLTIAQEEMESLQIKDDALIDQLRVEICNIESQLQLSQQQSQIYKYTLEETRMKYEKLSKDYADMHSTMLMLQKKSQENESSFSIEWMHEKKRLLEKVDNLMAQLMAANESLSNKNLENQSLMSENVVIRKQIEIVPLLQAQVEVYRDDFQAERNAREQQQNELEKIKEENHQLQLRNQQLQDEFNQINQMRLQDRQNRPIGNYERSPLNHRNQPTLSVEPQNPPGFATSQAPQKFLCPKCQKCFTTLSHVERHVDECLDDDNLFMM